MDKMMICPIMDTCQSKGDKGHCVPHEKSAGCNEPYKSNFLDCPGCIPYEPEEKVKLIKDASEVTGIWDITGGIDPVKYVREMRNDKTSKPEGQLVYLTPMVTFCHSCPEYYGYGCHYFGDCQVKAVYAAARQVDIKELAEKICNNLEDVELVCNNPLHVEVIEQAISEFIQEQMK